MDNDRFADAATRRPNGGRQPGRSGGFAAFRTRNVVIIVTPERAKQVEERTARMMAADSWGQLEREPAHFSTDTNTTDTRIKELEEKVKKLTEELEKSRKKN